MSSQRWNAFEQFVDQVMAEEHIVGTAVAVAQKGEIIYTKGFGVRNLETGEPVTPESIFGIASVSKSFTALMIMQLADEGKLSIDDPVTKFLPEFELKGINDMSTVKIKHLLSHTTGLPPMGRKQENKTFDQHLRYLATADYQLLGEPGEHVSYCNDTFLLLGEIIQRLTGRLYRRVMTDRLLDTLGMHRSTYSLEELARLDNVTVPYIYNRPKQQHEAQPWPELGNYEVGGGVRSNVLDLLKYGQVYVDGGCANGHKIVSRHGLEQMWQPVHALNRASSYALALQVTPNYSGVTLVEHGGGQPGVSSRFGFVPEKDLVAVVLTNVTGVSADSIWLAAVNTALGLPLEQKRSVEQEKDLTPREMQRYVGTYQSAEGGKFRLFIDGDQLKAENEGLQFELKASDEETLVYQYHGQKTLKFYFDAEGHPWAVFAGLRMLRKA